MKLTNKQKEDNIDAVYEFNNMIKKMENPRFTVRCNGVTIDNANVSNHVRSDGWLVFINEDDIPETNFDTNDSIMTIMGNILSVQNGNIIARITVEESED